MVAPPTAFLSALVAISIVSTGDCDTDSIDVRGKGPLEVETLVLESEDSDGGSHAESSHAFEGLTKFETGIGDLPDAFDNEANSFMSEDSIFSAYGTDGFIIDNEELDTTSFMQEDNFFSAYDMDGSIYDEELDEQIEDGSEPEFNGFLLSDFELDKVLDNYYSQWEDLQISLDEHIERVLERKIIELQSDIYDEEHIEGYDDDDEDIPNEEDIVGYYDDAGGISPLKGKERGLLRRPSRNPRKKTNKRNKRNKNKRKKNKRNKNKRNKSKRNKKPYPWSKNKFANKKYTGKMNRVYRNICLDPPDKHRTCFARADDPKSDVNCDFKIRRNQYNFGAQLFKRGRDYNPPPNGGGSKPPQPLKPYTEPYTARGEQFTGGTMHLSLLQVSKKISCDDMIDIEESVLQYLSDNVGDDESFHPVCVFVNENAVNQQIVRERNGFIVESTAFNIEITYASKKSFIKSINDSKNRGNQGRNQAGLRHLQQGGMPAAPGNPTMLNTCDTSNHQLCCSQSSINGNVGGFCSGLGCDRNRCGKRFISARPPPGPQPGRPDRPNRPKRPGRPNRPKRPSPNRPKRPGVTVRDLFYDEDEGTETTGLRGRKLQKGKNCKSFGFQGKTFTSMIRQNTAFQQTEMARSLLNDTDTSTVASCAVNWYVVASKGGVSTVTCDEFRAQDCANNQDLPFEEGQVLCLEPSSMPSSMPTSEPSEFPSSEPSEFPSSKPSEFPSSEPSLWPSLSPTEYPTQSPTEYPTQSPTDENPTLNPTMYPTQD